MAPRLFAHIFLGYYTLIEEGWEQHGAALEARQKEAESALLVDLDQRLVHRLDGTTLIGDVAYYPSEVHKALGIRPFAEPLLIH